jgi:hypothetical protein
MSLQRFPYPIEWPCFRGENSDFGANGALFALNTTSLAVDLAGEKISCGGHILWEDGATHTIGTSSTIKFRTGAVTWATATSTVRVGIQDFAGDGSGNTVQTPDGTFDVYRDIVVGDGLMTSSSDNVEIAATLTNGSKSVAHLQEIAVVFDMTTRAGSDSFTVAALTTGNSHRPGAMSYVSSAWITGGGFSPNILIISDDGARGVFMGTWWVTTQAQHDYQLSSNPDEYGMLFTAPFNGAISGIRAVMGANSASAEMVLGLYSDPLGTPAAVGTKTFPGESLLGSSTERAMVFMFDSPLRVTKGTKYAIGIRSTGSAIITLVYQTFSTTADKGPLGLSTCSKVSREGGTGAFTETAADVPGMTLMFESINVADGGAIYNLGMN